MSCSIPTPPGAPTVERAARPAGPRFPHNGAALPARHWVLWDGDCGLCRRSVLWAQRHDTRHRLHAVPYQRAPEPPMTPALRAACARAVHVLTTDGRTLRAGRAVLFVLGEIGWPRLARLAALPPFVWAVELGYRIVARHRPFFSRLLFRRR